MTNKQLHLGAFVFGAGQHVASWLHPESAAEQLLSPAIYEHIAKTAERGKFDLLLILEMLAVSEVDGKLEESKFYPTPDTMTLATILANATDKIGVGVTHTTSYNEPYQVAHKFATLSHYTKGRIGWNMVTTQDNKVAFNFSRDGHFDHTERYRRAGEFVDAVDQLWANSGSSQPVRYEGEFIQLEGQLPVPSLTYGRPIRVQAGSSTSGMAFGARFADAIFTAQTNLQDAQAFYKELKAQAVAQGRAATDIKIMPGLSPYLAATEEEARAFEQQLTNAVPIEVGLTYLSNLVDYDFSKEDLDAPAPLHLMDPDKSNNKKARIDIVRKKAEQDRLTLRELAQWVFLGGGHYPFVGTPTQLADFMQQWLEQEACDGFVIMPPLYPKSIDDFVDQVVPILQARGIYRKDYSGQTLLDHLQEV